jgi:hypothetical protein
MHVLGRFTIAEVDDCPPLFIMIYYMIDDLWIGWIVSQFSDVKRSTQRL